MKHICLCLALTFVAAPSSAQEGRVGEVLREMGDLLAGTSSFAFKAEEVVDEVLDSGFKAELSHIRTVAVQRPGRVVSSVDGDSMHRTAWFDGQAVTVLDRQHNRYAVMDTPNTIDAMLDHVVETFDVVFPLADVLHSDVHGSLTEAAAYSEYLGIHQVEGRRCHHLAFANEFLEWQIWVDAEGEPLPRKLTITYMDEPGEPKYTARFLSWNLDPDLADDLFTFVPPEGAEEMEAVRLVERNP